MRFKHKKGAKKKGSWLNKVLLLISVGGLAAGLYLLILVLSPSVPLIPIEPIDAKSLPKPKENMIYIPKIGVSVPIATGGPEALDKGSWHRFPERGDPVEGGNFIISAHRFSLGITPGETRQKSPFYHIDKLAVGDQILIDFEGTRYGYEITTHSEVKPTQTEIEAPLEDYEEPKMTLYTCTLKGESDGREVYIAKPLGKVTNGMVDQSQIDG